jgi:hypothetical protein
MRKLRQHNFDIFAYMAVQDKTSIYVLLRAPLEKLRAFADIHSFPILLDPEVTQRLLEAGNPEKGIAPVKLEHRDDITHLKPFENIYGEYSRGVDELLYWRDSNRSDPFCRPLRLKLSLMILHSSPPGRRHISFHTTSM